MNKEFIIVLIIYFLVKTYYFYIVWNKSYISKSLIHGNGLFAGRNYKKGEVIFKNLFPYKKRNKVLYYLTDINEFKDSILKEGTFINHCSISNNIDVKTKDYINFPVIAKKNIKKHDELVANYDFINSKIPFIAPSCRNYMKC
jgi:hypothetical protein